MAKLIFRTTLNSTLTRLKKILRTLLLILHCYWTLQQFLEPPLIVFLHFLLFVWFYNRTFEQTIRSSVPYPYASCQCVHVSVHAGSFVDLHSQTETVGKEACILKAFNH